MNKVTNLLLLAITFPIMAVTIFVGFDLPIEMLKTSGANLPYQDVIYWILSALVFLLIARRSIRRWIGMRLLSQESKFQYNQEISLERKNRVVVYNMIEAGILLFIAYAIYRVSNQAWPITLAYGMGFVDQLMFTFIGYFGKKWRLGVTKKAIVIADREVSALYFLGLRKIYISQDTLYFEYIEDLHLDLPIVSAPDRKVFLQKVMENINHEKVFVDESIKRELID
jgi:hypothetical protein